MSNFITGAYSLHERKQTEEALQEIANQVAGIRPDTIVFIASKESAIKADAIVLSGDDHIAGMVVDQELRQAIQCEIEEGGITINQELKPTVDDEINGVMSCIQQVYPTCSIIFVGVPDGTTMDMNDIGKAIEKQCDQQERRCVFFAHGDSAQVLLEDVLSGYQVDKQDGCYYIQERDPYVRLAKQALETFVLEGSLLSAEENAEAELLSKRAGIFVTLTQDQELRGCIGTAVSVRDCVAQEVIENAISAGAYDMRFDRVSKEELPSIFYSVDVLGAFEEVPGPEELDHTRYGVVVSNGLAQGLLLPNLAGVDSVQTQLEMAQEKAEILPGTPVTIYRFEVERHI